MNYLERLSYGEHDIYRALDVLVDDCNFIQLEAFKNSNFLVDRNDGILYYDCTNYCFEIEQKDETRICRKKAVVWSRKQKSL